MATLGGGAPNTPYARRRVDVRLAEQAVHRRINIATVTTMENIVAHHNPTLYGGSKYTLHQIFIAFLYFLTHNMSYRKLEMETGLPHSNMKQWFGTIRRILLPYCLQQVSIKQTANDRLNIAQQVDGVRTENTVIVDGIHFQVANGHGNEQYLGNSFKLKKPARSFQVAINRARKVVFISSGYGANVHDIAAWREAWPNFVQVTGFDVTREKVVADAGYQGMPHHITPKKKPRNGNLSSEEQRWNTNIATKRSLVEQLFGGVKNMFRFLDKAFNGTVERFDDLVVLAFAIFEWNLMICANIQPNVLNIPQGTAQAAPVQAQYMQVPPPAPTVAPAPTTSAPVLQGPLPPLSAHIYRAVQVRPSQGPQGPAVAPAAPIQGPTPAPRQQPAQVPPNFQRPEQRSEQRPAPAPRQQPIQGALPAAPIQGPTQGSAQGSTSGSAAQAQRVGNGGNVISTPPVNLSQLVSFLRLN